MATAEFSKFSGILSAAVPQHHLLGLWKILKEMGIPEHLTCLLRNLYAVQEATEQDMKQTGSKLGKEYKKSIYCHCAYLTCMQSTS